MRQFVLFDRLQHLQRGEAHAVEARDLTGKKRGVLRGELADALLNSLAERGGELRLSDIGWNPG